MQNLILTLRQLVQEASVASNPQKRVQGIVARVKSAMNVEVCSLYRADEEGTLTLVATEGLNPDSVGKIQLGLGEGLVGWIAETQHPLNLERASEDPHFRYFPGIGEEGLEAFLGAPVVHEGGLTGVLVVEQRGGRKFSEEEESFLVTAAAQLGALSPVDFQIEESVATETTGGQTRRLRGVAGSPGVGIGRPLLLFDGSDLMRVVDTPVKDVEGECQNYRRAVEEARQELAAGQQRLAGSITADVAGVFEVYQMLLQSGDFNEAVERRITGGNSAAGSLRAVVSDYVAVFEGMEDPYLRSRAEDIRNLGSRVYACLRNASPAEIAPDEKVILVGVLVSIADIAAHPVDQLAGIVSMEGSALSHTAVLAKALGLPAAMGIGPMGDLPKDEVIIVDGYQGQVMLSPTPAVLDEFRRLIDVERAFVDELAKLKDLPAETPDGHRVHLFANTGLLADMTPGLARGAEGIGLYRSEIPFMLRESFPSEDEQVEVYRTVLSAYAGMPVSMRTLDTGGDKPLPYYPVAEENPALGWRGVRFTLDNSAVYMTQIRAMLRASEGLDNLHIMLPMVGSVAEVEAFFVLFDSACRQLAEEKIVIQRPKVGIMAEVPSVIPILPFLAGKIDFISIGSNDLSQYLLAVDRNNARVARLYDHLHPAVLHAVQEIVNHAKRLDVPVSVCGEMAADPCAAVLLLAMGIETLSTAAFSIPKIKWLIRTVSIDEARAQLELAMRSAHPGEIRARLHDFLVAQGLGSLLEPTGA